MTGNGSVQFFTICARNYLAYALTLFNSLRTHHPEAAFTVFLADHGDVGAKPLPFNVIEASRLDLPSLYDMAVRYSVMEFATAIKPACFLHMFDKLGVKNAVYLDPDIYVTASLDRLSDILETEAELILTPHIRAPFPDGAHPDDRQLLNAGCYNLGFAAMRDSPEVRTLLTWWQGKLLGEGHNDLEKGQFVDQRYMDLAPSLVARTHILHDCGYNAAYWNLHERPVKQTPDGWMAGFKPLRFFHFSGVVPGDHSIFSKHQNRYDRSGIGDLQILLDDYLNKLGEAGYAEWSSLPYAFDRYADGTKISAYMRRCFAAGIHPEISPYTKQGGRAAKVENGLPVFDPNPFLRTDETTNEPILIANARREREDLARAFPAETRAGRHGLANWFRANGASAFDLPQSLVDAALEAMHMGSETGTKAAPLSARAANRLLAAAPSLRPVYRHLPVGLRARVKTALFRTNSRAGTAPETGPRMTAATGRFDRDRQPGIHLFGYLRAESGIGEAARGLFSALDAASVPLAATAVENLNDPRERHRFQDRKAPAGGMRIALLHLNAEQTLSLHELIDPKRLTGTYRIGYWVWELARFPEAWEPALSTVDEIWVPSTFVAEALRAVTEKPVHVVPHAVAPAPAVDPSASFPELSREKPVVLTAFDANSYPERKNPEAAIEAFRRAFNATSDGPVLAIKVNGAERRPETVAQLQALAAERPDLVVIERPLSRGAFLALHARADCFLSLHRSEGFGLNLAEAMALGKPVIATDYGGSRDFLTDATGWPVSAKPVCVPDGAYPFATGQFWAEPDIDCAARALATLMADPALRKRLGEAARAHINQQYSPAVIGALARDRLEVIDPALAARLPD